MITRIFTLLFLFLIIFICSKQQPSLIIQYQEGNENTQIQVDEMSLLDATTAKKASMNFAKKGDTWEVVIPMEEWRLGIYGVRIGAKSFILPIDDISNTITLKVSDKSLQEYTNEVQGNKSIADFNQFLAAVRKTNGDRAEVTKLASQFVNTTSSGIVAMAVASQFLADPAFKKDLLALKTKHESLLKSKIGEEFDFVVNKISSMLSIGQPAPELSYASPSGKEYSLSELKGKVVLIDFWASWCKPCRYNNPHIVSLYDKYNKQGFEVFSVSLDQDKTRWIEAIKADNLKWPYHISDLSGWESKLYRLYPSEGIPATFLVDKNGNLASFNIRDPKQIETLITQLLAAN